MSSGFYRREDRVSTRRGLFALQTWAANAAPSLLRFGDGYYSCHTRGNAAERLWALHQLLTKQRVRGSYERQQKSKAGRAARRIARHNQATRRPATVHKVRRSCLKKRPFREEDCSSQGFKKGRPVPRSEESLGSSAGPGEPRTTAITLRAGPCAGACALELLRGSGSAGELLQAAGSSWLLLLLPVR